MTTRRAVPGRFLELAPRRALGRVCLLLLLAAALTPRLHAFTQHRIGVVNASPHPTIYCLVSWIETERYHGNESSFYRSNYFEVKRPTTSFAPGVSLLSSQAVQDVEFHTRDYVDGITLQYLLCFDNEKDRRDFDWSERISRILASLVSVLAPSGLEEVAGGIEYALYQAANGDAPGGLTENDVRGVIGGARLVDGLRLYVRGRGAPSLRGSEAVKVLRRELALGINGSFAPAFADVTGDGRADFCRPASDPGGQTVIVCTPGDTNGYALGAAERQHKLTNVGTASFPRTFADVDGDKRADFCRLVIDFIPPFSQFIACDLAADGFGSDSPFAVTAGDPQYAYRSSKQIDLGYDWFPRAFADVNGDGRADFCRLVGDPHSPFIACNLAGSSGFGDDQYAYRSRAGIATGLGHFPRAFADVNGDGRADFCRLVEKPGNGIACSLAGANGFDTGDSYISNPGVDLGYDWFPRVFVDVNGDKRADFCRLVGDPHNPSIACNLADRDRFGADPYQYQSKPGIRLGADAAYARFPRVFTDLNGDGRADFVRLKSLTTCEPLECLEWTFAAASGFEAETHGSSRP